MHECNLCSCTLLPHSGQEHTPGPGFYSVPGSFGRQGVAFSMGARPAGAAAAAAGAECRAADDVPGPGAYYNPRCIIFLLEETYYDKHFLPKGLYMHRSKLAPVPISVSVAVILCSQHSLIQRAYLVCKLCPTSKMSLNCMLMVAWLLHMLCATHSESYELNCSSGLVFQCLYLMKQCAHCACAGGAVLATVLPSASVGVGERQGRMQQHQALGSTSSWCTCE